MYAGTGYKRNGECRFKLWTPFDESIKLEFLQKEQNINYVKLQRSWLPGKDGDNIFIRVRGAVLFINER